MSLVIKTITFEIFFPISVFKKTIIESMIKLMFSCFNILCWQVKICDVKLQYFQYIFLLLPVRPSRIWCLDCSLCILLGSSGSKRSLFSEIGIALEWFHPHSNASPWSVFLLLFDGAWLDFIEPAVWIRSPFGFMFVVIYFSMITIKAYWSIDILYGQS